MKYLFFGIAVIFFLFSCSQSTDPSPTQQPSLYGKISYKVNGQLVTFDNANIINGEYCIFAKQLSGSLPYTRYLFNGQKGLNELLVFPIKTDSLSVRNYYIDSANIPPADIIYTSHNGQTSDLFFSTDFFSINITSHSNGKISGNFTGKMTPFSISTPINYDLRGTVQITEGIIDNVKCTY